MEFDLISFTLYPSWEVYNRCRKKDLIQIADFYNIIIPKESSKQVIKEELFGELVKIGVLVPPDEESIVGVESDAVVETAESDSIPNMGPKDTCSEPLLAIKLKEIELKLKQEECEAERIKLRMVEVKGDRDIELRRLEIEALKLRRPVPLPRSSLPSSSVVKMPEVDSVKNSRCNSSDYPFDSPPDFDVGKFIRLVPSFRETEVDSYFTAFERIAAKLRWPKDMWVLLLQSNFVGKAQEVSAALPIEQALDYDVVKTAVLRAYELVPEAYRQKFRSHVKSARQTFVEFAREKKTLFDKWCLSSGITTFEQLQELILLEDFKMCAPENVVVYLNEQKVQALADAAIAADEFVLTHRNVFSGTRLHKSQPSMGGSSEAFRPSSRNINTGRDYSSQRKLSPKRAGDGRACFFCLDPNHLISECKAWKHKNAASKSKSVALMQSVPRAYVNATTYQPFICTGTVSLSSESKERQLRILRDTGAAQSFILEDQLPFSAESYTGTDVLVRGFGMVCVNVPLHQVYLKSELVTGLVTLGVCSQLPVDGVDFILGNDLAGGKVFPRPIVVHEPVVTEESEPVTQYRSVFPACAVTRAQSLKFGDVSDLSDTVLFSQPEDMERVPKVTSEVELENIESPVLPKITLRIGKVELAAAQITDPSLATCRDAVVDCSQVPKARIAYFWEDGILMRKWKPLHCDAKWQEVRQIVLPTDYRHHVLELAHENVLAGHLGVTKTFHRITRYFFWPGLKSAVSTFVRSCHTCQLVGKPNQTIPVAPLKPIPVLHEPFEWLLIDCVGPLPKSKTGHQYILTIMCTATRYPEAIPLRTIKAKSVVKEIIRFCSLFGLPKVIQSDQGSNFTSKVFSQILRELGVKHQLASAYHPESQGALERFHQTLKAMLRRFCTETGRDWVEGLPLMMFAIRESVQESLGFSPAELVFGHTVRGPLRLLSEQLLSQTSTPVSVLEYVTSFRERLHQACQLARTHLVESQEKMKTRFDHKSVRREFQTGEPVLALLPVSGTTLQAKFSGPYIVEKKLSDTNYVIGTPERRRKSRVCHVNMLKAYTIRNVNPDVPVKPVSAAVVLPTECLEEDGLIAKDAQTLCARLQNSVILSDLRSYLIHLTEEQRKAVSNLIVNYSDLFSDVPSQTTLLCHDIDVGDSQPIKQHPYRINPKKRVIMKSEVTYLVAHGFATRSQSPWSSPCILVPKSDSTFRFCTDYRKVNAVTRPDSFPLPRMEDCVDKVGAAHYVTKLDLLKGYWQVPLTPRASEISAFVTPDSFLQYSVMAFGMRNAPATFQRLMNRVLSEVNNVEVYLDDVVIYSNTWEEHLEKLRVVFERLSRASLTLNLAKCEFAKATVTYLGKCVGQGQVRPVEAKVAAIVEFPKPTNKRELRRFLGMSGYYRSFCKNFAAIVSPLTDLLSASRKFVWTPECMDAFNAAKDLLCTAPVLSAPNFARPFKLQVDASAAGAGAVLMQEDGAGVDHPVSFFSKKFTKCQLNYSVIEKEALALLLALQNFEVYLGGSDSPILVYTDHNPLVFLTRMSNTNQRLMRWSLIVQEYHLDIRHKKGIDNIIADALSRTHSLDS